MRWVASLFALGLMMAFLHRVTAGGPLEARATLALGFLLLAAYIGGELASRVRLPRITGYLLVGFAVSPAWLGLVRRDEVAALRFIQDATGALIALAAGAELTLEALRRGRIALARLATGAIVFPVIAVALVVLSVRPWFPLTVHQSFGNGVAVALVLGTLAAASSPAFSMAVISELDTPGPIARTVLRVTIVQDIAATVLLALVLALAQVVTRAGAVNPAVAGDTVVDLGGSLAVGAALGFGVGRYVRLAERATPLLLVAVAFVAAVVGRFTHLETILIALAAGFYLENWSRVESERLRPELRRMAPLVYAAFFAVTGADLRVGVLSDLWPWALLLVGLRVLSLRYGFLWAGRHPSVIPALARNGWLGLISQAGIALGLGRFVRRAFPEWGVSLEALIVAMIGVHAVAGPICFRWALIRAAEVTEGTPDVAGPGGSTRAVAPRGTA